MPADAASHTLAIPEDSTAMNGKVQAAWRDAATAVILSLGHVAAR